MFIFLGLAYTLYAFLTVCLIKLAKIIYRRTRSVLMIILLVSAVALIASCDILLGNYTYNANSATWPDFAVYKKVDTVTKFDELGRVEPILFNFDLKEFIKQAAVKYKNNKNVYSDARPNDLKVDTWSTQNVLVNKRFVAVDYKIGGGTCEMRSYEIYDLESEELLGLTRWIILKNISYVPFFNSMLGSPFWGYSNQSKKGEIRTLLKEVFPNCKLP